MKDRVKFEKVLGRKDCSLVLHILDNYVEFAPIFYNKRRKFFSDRDLDRDYTMWKNVQKIMEIYAIDPQQDRILLYAHSGHLDKVNNCVPVYSLRNSLGYYLNRSFGENYAVFAHTVGKGEHRVHSVREERLKSESVMFPPFGSFESLFAGKEQTTGFVWASDIPSGINRLRQSLQQYFPREDLLFPYLSIKNRYDGIIYFKEGEAIEAFATVASNDMRLKRYYHRLKVLHDWGLGID